MVVKFCGNNVHYAGSMEGSTLMVGKSEEHAQTICYPTPAVPSSRHEGIHNNSLGGAGDWILEISEWREWRERES